MSIIISDSVDGKPPKVNQDYQTTFSVSETEIKGVIVADGIGSSAFAELASKVVSEDVKQSFESMKKEEEIDFVNFFSKAHDSVLACAKTNNPDCEDTSAFGTTLLVCAETEFDFKLAYIGNGAIFHLRGNFFKFSDSYILPWNTVVNYLNPHCEPNSKGKSALYKNFSLHTDKRYVVPTTHTISKDKMYGDIFLLVTDGIYSVDEDVSKIAQFNDPTKAEEKRTAYLPITPAYKMIIKNLKQAFNNYKELDSDLIRNVVLNSLIVMKDEEIIDDDATIGIIISDDFLNYHKSISVNEN